MSRKHEAARRRAEVRRLLAEFGSNGFGLGKPVRLQIAEIGEEVLRESANALSREEILSAKTQELIEHIRDTMRNAFGVGFAAPKVGVPLQLAVIEDHETYHKKPRSSLRLNCRSGLGQNPAGPLLTEVNRHFNPPVIYLYLAPPRKFRISMNSARWRPSTPVLPCSRRRSCAFPSSAPQYLCSA